MCGVRMFPIRMSYDNGGEAGYFEFYGAEIHHNLCKGSLRWSWVFLKCWYGLEWYSVHPLSHVSDQPGS